MKAFNWRMIVGGLLVLLGLVSFLDILTDLPMLGLFWGLVFAGGGVGFLAYYRHKQTEWWALIPGIILLGLSATIVLDTLIPSIGNRVGGFIFLGGISLAFWIIYAINHQNWWAIIPGGVVGTLAVTTLVDVFVFLEAQYIFLFGVALTFVLLTILPGMPGNRSWPWIPAGVFTVIGLLVLIDDMNASRFLLPVILIGIGALLIGRNFLKK